MAVAFINENRYKFFNWSKKGLPNLRHFNLWRVSSINRFLWWRWCVVIYRLFSLTWPASMQIYWNKRKCCTRNEFNSQRIGSGHQHGRRDVMWKHSIRKLVNLYVVMQERIKNGKRELYFIETQRSSKRTALPMRRITSYLLSIYDFGITGIFEPESVNNPGV